MTDTRKVQVGSAMDARPVTEGLEKIVQGAQGMARDVTAAGAQAAAGLGKVGEGAGDSAQKFDRATSGIIASVQRATAALKAGEKSGADYFEALANQRGANVDALKPYLDQLRAAQAEQKKAAQGLDNIGASAGQVKAALRQLPAQFTDIFTSLAGGQQPITVLLQQGGQIKDSFGGVGVALRETAKYALGLVNPLTILGGVAAGLAVAYKAGGEEVDRFTNTLTLSGNPLGTTADKLATLSANLGAVTGNQGRAADVLNDLASSAKVGTQNLERFTLAAINLERAGGPAATATAEAFAKLANQPYQAAVKLNEATNFLTASQLRQIKSLEDAGRTTEAARVAQEAYASAVEQRTPKLESTLGLLERAWRSVSDAAKGAWDAAKGIGREDTLQQQVDKTIKAIEEVERARQKGASAQPALGASLNSQAQIDAAAAKRTAELQAQLSLYREQIRLQDRAAQQDAERARTAATMTRWLDDEGKYLDKQAQARREIAKVEADGQRLVSAGLINEQQLRERVAAVRAKYADQGADNELASLRARLKETNAYIDGLTRQGAVTRELTEGEKQAAQIREQLAGNLTASARSQKEQALVIADELGARQRLGAELKRQIDDYAKLTDTVGQQADTIRQRAADQEAANAVFGQGKSAVEALTLAELKKQAADLEATNSVDPKYLANLNAKIDAQERFVRSLKAADYKQLNNGLDEWLRSATEQQRLFEDEQQLTGLTRLEREKILAARQVELKLAKQLADIDRANLTDAEKETLRIKAREAAEIESSAAVARVVRDDWSRTSDQIEQSLTDALMNGGKSGADYLRGLFRTLVLRPIIQATVQPVAGQVGGAVNSLLGSILPGLGGASGGGGGLSSLLGSGSSLGSIGSLLGLGSSGALGTTVVKGLSNVGGWLANNGFEGAADWLAGSSGAIGQAVNIGGNVFGYGSALYGLSQGRYGSAAGAALGTFFGGPIGSAIGSTIGTFVDKVFSGGAGTPHRGSIVTGTDAGVVTGGYDPNNILGHYEASTDAALKTLTASALQVLNSTASAFGRAGGYGAEAYFTADGKDPTFAGLKLTRSGAVVGTTGYTDGRNQYSSNAADAFTSFTSDAAKAVRDALLAMDLPAWARKQVEGLASTASVDEVAQVAQQIATAQQALKGVGDSFASLGGALARLGAQGSDAVAGLAELSGGLEQLAANVTGYAQNYYSRDEIAGGKARDLQQALAGVGITADISGTDARAQFRALVEGTDVSTEAGKKRLATLLGLQGDFANVADYLGETGKSLGEVAASAPDSSIIAPLLASGTTQQVAATNEVRDAVVALGDTLTALLTNGGGSGGGSFMSNRWREVTLAGSA